MSVPQNGETLSDEFCPTSTCAASVFQLELMSPDHTQPP